MFEFHGRKVQAPCAVWTSYFNLQTFHLGSLKGFPNWPGAVLAGKNNQMLPKIHLWWQEDQALFPVLSLLFSTFLFVGRAGRLQLRFFQVQIIKLRPHGAVRIIATWQCFIVWWCEVYTSFSEAACIVRSIPSSGLAGTPIGCLLSKACLFAAFRL